jgi:hypothetical protein
MMTESRRMKWERDLTGMAVVVYMGAYKIVVGKPEGKNLET